MVAGRAGRRCWRCINKLHLPATTAELRAHGSSREAGADDGSAARGHITETVGGSHSWRHALSVRCKKRAATATSLASGLGLDANDADDFLQAAQTAHHPRQVRPVRHFNGEFHVGVVTRFIIFGVHIGDVGIG